MDRVTFGSRCGPCKVVAVVVVGGLEGEEGLDCIPAPGP